MTDEAVGFWSYAHQDDEADGGGILRLATRLGEEYSLLTGDELTLFVDRSIKWGDFWRQRIDGALAETTFFLPIVTPRFFRRDECRKELLEFAGQTQSLGVQEFLLPILYADVQDLREDSPDPALALVASTQHFDWRAVRLAGADSAEYRGALNQLATRLVEIARTVSARQLSVERSPAAEPKTLDLLQLVAARWPTLVNLIDEDRITEAQYRAIWDAQHARLARLTRSGRRGARPVVIAELARQLMPLAERHHEMTQEYAALAVELDSAVVSLFRQAATSDDAMELIGDLRIDIEDINQRIDISQGVPDFLISYAKESRYMQQLRDTFDRGDRYVDEGNAILGRWRELVVTSRDNKG